MIKLEEVIETTATTLRDAMKEQGTKIKKQEIKAGLVNMMLTLAKGETVAPATAATDETAPMGYNLSGEMLNLAYLAFNSGKKAEGLKMAAMAFAESDCTDLMDIIVKCNSEAELANDSTVTADADDEDETIIGNDDENEEDRVINEVLSAMTDDDDDDDDDDNDDDDDDSDDDDSDDNDDDDDDSDDDDNEDSDDDDKMMASALEKLKNNPEVIAAANKISLKKDDPKAKQKAKQFIISAANKAA